MTPISRLNISISIGKMFEILSLKSLIHLKTNHSIYMLLLARRCAHPTPYARTPCLSALAMANE